MDWISRVKDWHIVDSAEGLARHVSRDKAEREFGRWLVCKKVFVVRPSFRH
ncbi:MAG: hypothetical protein WCL50_04485 [Spirochaetota bacterium]